MATGQPKPSTNESLWAIGAIVSNPLGQVNLKRSVLFISGYKPKLISTSNANTHTWNLPKRSKNSSSWIYLAAIHHMLYARLNFD